MSPPFHKLYSAGRGPAPKRNVASLYINKYLSFHLVYRVFYGRTTTDASAAPQHPAEACIETEEDIQGEEQKGF